MRASYQDELTLRSSQSFVFYIPPAVFDLEFESSLTLSTNFLIFPALAHQNNACSVECKSDVVGKKRRLNQRIDKLTDGFLPWLLVIWRSLFRTNRKALVGGTGL